jgi:hypothetical protein
MKQLFFLFLFTGFSLNLLAQEQEKLGSIVFESCKYMANQHLAPSQSDKKKEKDKFKKFIEQNIDAKNAKEFINSIPKTDIETYGDSLKCTYKLDIYNEVYESKVVCDYLQKTNMEIYKQIDRKTLIANTVQRNINSNAYKIFDGRPIDFYSTADRYELLEFKDDTKVILGYKCFKVVLKKKFQKNPHLTTYDYEMYVTEDIKLNYHPAYRNKDILEKYFPLEIIKKPRQEIMAEAIVWNVKQIDLTNL